MIAAIDISDDINRLRQRLYEQADTAIKGVPYVHLKGKRKSEQKSAKLNDLVDHFLASPDRVLLLLGEVGSGKTLFCQQLIIKLCQSAPANPDYIPLYISLGYVNLQQDIIIRTLKQYKLSEEQIIRLKQRQKFLFILDDYKDLGEFVNLYQQLQLQQWQAKVIITCSTLHLISIANYRVYFSPINYRQSPIKDLEYNVENLQEARIMPLDRHQIKKYLRAYVRIAANSQQNNWPKWRDYYSNITRSQTINLRVLASYPLSLKITLDILPSVVQEHGVIPFAFFVHWLHSWLLYHEEKFKALDKLPQGLATLIPVFTCYCKALAEQMHQLSLNEIQHQPQSNLFERLENKWDSFFQNKDELITLARSALPLYEIQPFHYAFLHPLLKDYLCNANVLLDELRSHELNQKLILQNLELIRHFAERIRENETFKNLLRYMLIVSKFDSKLKIGGENAAAILKFEKDYFNQPIVVNQNIMKTALSIAFPFFDAKCLLQVAPLVAKDWYELANSPLIWKAKLNASKDIKEQALILQKLIQLQIKELDKRAKREIVDKKNTRKTTRHTKNFYLKTIAYTKITLSR